MARPTRAVAYGLMVGLLAGPAAPAPAWMRTGHYGARVPFFGRYASSYSIHHSYSRPQGDLWCIEQRYLASRRPREERRQGQEATQAVDLDKECGKKEGGPR